MKKLLSIFIFVLAIMIFYDYKTKNMQQLDLSNVSIIKKWQNNISDKISETVSKSKISLFTKLTNINETEMLIEQNFSYGDIIKLKIISSLTNVEILDLIEEENVVTIDEDNNKQVNFNYLIDKFKLSEAEIKELWQEYKAKLLDIIDLN